MRGAADLPSLELERCSGEREREREIRGRRWQRRRRRREAAQRSAVSILSDIIENAAK